MRRVAWAAGSPVRWALGALFRLWRGSAGRLLGPRCRFHPSCSAYAEEAVRTHGVIRGLGLAAWRVARCSPLSSGGLDPVPRRYDGVIRGGA